ncbi:MAG: hypothetical protein R3E01_36195 [Pirellulaceae bacterium]|nr:hypothetical protein [Planctomycetales bacterium]
MTHDVPSEYENILRNAVASGRFETQQAALLYALQLLAQQQPANFPNIGGQVRNEETAYDAFHSLSVIGCMKPGPSDLATNSEQMNGFGR